jgi:hypothetical protein
MAQRLRGPAPLPLPIPQPDVRRRCERPLAHPRHGGAATAFLGRGRGYWPKDGRPSGERSHRTMPIICGVGAPPQQGARCGVLVPALQRNARKPMKVIVFIDKASEERHRFIAKEVPLTACATHVRLECSGNRPFPAPIAAAK